MYFKHFLSMLIFLGYFNFAYANSFTVICNGVGSNVAVNNFVQDDPPYSHVYFKINNAVYEFENNQIERNDKLSFFSTVVNQGETRLGYYVVAPSDLSLAAPILHGKIFIVVNKSNQVIYSSEYNVVCRVLT